MRVCDYVTEYLTEKLGIDTIFIVSGGGSIFLSDGILKNKNLSVICNHHEQASAMAASGYARKKNSFGAALLTTGCGGTNAITGLLGAYQDSIPVIFISGQSKRSLCTRNSAIPLRQLGVQEVDIIKIVESLTNYSVMINDPNQIKYELDKAIFLATCGRPGPVWIDIPQDVQSTIISVEDLESFNKDEDHKQEVFFEENIKMFYELLSNCQRPVIIAGNGVRLSKMANELVAFSEHYRIPVVTTYLSADILPTEHVLNIGRIGAKGTRAANFCVQNSDLVISFGSRLDISAIGHEPANFARSAKIVVFDIDKNEHRKDLVKIDLFIHSNLKKILPLINSFISSNPKIYFKEWASQAKKWKTMWPVCLSEYSENQNDLVNMYLAVDSITKAMPDHSTVVSDAGSAFYVTSQAGSFNNTQRYVTSGGQAEMGFTLPAAIGVAAADRSSCTVGITGDGSLQMNLQELQTVVHNNLNIKLFVLNNDGYLSIRSTQNNLFNGNLIGTDKTSGVSFPSTKKICDAYEIKYYSINSVKEIKSTLKDVFSSEMPVVCEFFCPRDQEKLYERRALRDGLNNLLQK